MNSALQKRARRDKENNLNRACAELEEDNASGKTRNLFRKVKEITGTFTSRLSGVKAKDGKILTEENAVKDRWKEYTEELYKKDNNVTGCCVINKYDIEPEILIDEVQKAVKSLAVGKAPGYDGFPLS